MDMHQKQSVLVNGMRFRFVPRRWEYAQDGRVNNPVLARVVAAADDVPMKPEDIVLLSHNSGFDQARQVEEGFILPYDRWILATVDKDGELIPTPSNIVASRVYRDAETVGEFYVPESARTAYADRVDENGVVWGIKRWADYEVFYNWNDEERRRIIVWKEDIVCKISS